MNNAAATTDAYLAGLPGWQAERLRTFRELIHQASGEITEDIKWGVPVFIYRSKVIFAMSGFKSHVKYNFILNGALLDDPNKLFNNGLESKKSRGIDVTEGEVVNPGHLAELIDAATKAVD